MKKVNEKLVDDYLTHYGDFWEFISSVSYVDNLVIDDKYFANINNIFSSVDGYKQYLSLPYKKTENLKKAFNCYSEVIGIIDETVFGSAKNGVVFAVDGIYFKELFEAPQKISYYEFCNSMILPTGDVTTKYQPFIGSTNSITTSSQKGAGFYQLANFLYYQYDDIKYYLWHKALDIIIKVLGDIENPLNRIGMINIPNIIENEYVPERHIIIAAKAVCSLAEGDYSNVEASVENIPELEWIKDMIPLYRSDLSEESFNECIQAAKGYELRNEYNEAISLYKDALSYREDLDCMLKILDLYYVLASKNNDFNISEYNEFLERAKEISNGKDIDIYINNCIELQKKKDQYYSSVIKNIPKAILDNNIHYFQENHIALTIDDDIGMNAFLYAVLYGNINILDIFDNSQIEGYKSKKNILEHGYLEVAAINGEKYFYTILSKYDEEYSYKIKKIHRDEKINTAMRYGTLIASGVFNGMANAADNAIRQGDVVLTDDQNTKVANARKFGGMLKESSDNFKSKAQGSGDVIEKYKYNRYIENINRVCEDLIKKNITDNASQELSSDDYISAMRKIRESQSA